MSGVKHVKALTRRPARAEDTEPDLPFIIATLEFVLTILEALNTKKQLQETDTTT